MTGPIRRARGASFFLPRRFDDEDRQFAEGPAGPPPRQQAGSSSRARLHHQQDGQALQGPPGLIAANSSGAYEARLRGPFCVARLAQAPAKAARMRIHERMPRWKLVRLYFSLGEWMRSSACAKPMSSVSSPSRRLKSPATGIEPPEAVIAA